jgi:hypothetical protein
VSQGLPDGGRRASAHHVLVRATGVHSVVYNSANADAHDGTMNTSD